MRRPKRPEWSGAKTGAKNVKNGAKIGGTIVKNGAKIGKKGVKSGVTTGVAATSQPLLAARLIRISSRKLRRAKMPEFVIKWMSAF
jgi:hypothetical protein